MYYRSIYILIYPKQFACIFQNLILKNLNIQRIWFATQVSNSQIIYSPEKTSLEERITSMLTGT